MMGKKIGILGGGQLGKMLALAAGNWHQEIWVLDQSKDFPAGPFCSNFVEGDFRNFDDVLNFGRQVDILTVEIEHVNIKALIQLEKEGIIIHPSPEKLEIIKDKGLQKNFLQTNQIPTPDFQLFESETEITNAILSGSLKFPFVQKSRTEGYDGRGVSIIKEFSDLDTKLLRGPAVVERLVEIEKELAVIVSMNQSGEMRMFPPVEMVFNQDANLVEFLVCPAKITIETLEKVEKLCKQTAAAFQVCGLLAIEMFLTKKGEILVNEVAPRPHNSGHHTIESCFVSQFEQHLRGILNLPLGKPDLKVPAVMINLLGEPGFLGSARITGLEESMQIPGSSFHFYGKKETKPFRKMGHVTLTGFDREKLIENAKKVQQTLKVISNG